MRITIVTRTENTKNVLKFIDFDEFLTALNDLKWAGYQVTDYMTYMEGNLCLVMEKRRSITAVGSSGIA